MVMTGNRSAKQSSAPSYGGALFTLYNVTRRSRVIAVVRPRMEWE
jgi:hypothetical protein